MKKLHVILLLITFIFFSAIPGVASSSKKLSQFEIREVQTHVYNTSDTNQVFKATINALQDEGFTIVNIEDGLGYIRAKKEFKSNRVDKKRVTIYSIQLACAIASGSASSIVDPSMRLQNELADKTVVVDANANIEPFGKQTRVRFTMVEKVLENADGYSYVKSSPRSVVRIYNPSVYQAFFNEIDKSIFYEKI